MSDESVDITGPAGESMDAPTESVSSVSIESSEDVTDETSKPEAVSEDVRSGVEEITPSQSSAGSFCCSFVADMNPQARDLIYWRNPIRSGVVLGATVVALLMMCCHGFINTVSYFGLIILALSFAVTAVGYVTKRFLGKDIPNPLRQVLDQPFEVSDDTVEAFAQCTASHCQRVCTELRRLYCIVDIPDSFKFGIALWLVYWITSRVGFFELAIIAEVFLFSVPKLYDLYQVQIDQAAAVGKQQALVYIEKARTVPYVDQVMKMMAPKEKQT